MPALTILTVTVFATPGAADPIVITSGAVALGSAASGIDPPFGFEVRGDNTLIRDVHFGIGTSGFTAQQVVSLSGTLTAGSFNFPLSEVINGTPYRIFPITTFAFSALPFVAPPGVDGQFVSFSTPFTMTGRARGFDNRERAGVPLFDVALSGTGIASVGPARVIGSGVDATYLVQGATVFRFEDPSQAPEPATLLFVGTGLTLIATRFRRYSSRSRK